MGPEAYAYAAGWLSSGIVGTRDQTFGENERAANLTPKVAQDFEALLEKLDEFVLQQARVLGWRILLSTWVHNRMSCWQKEERGCEKFEKLGVAMGRASRIFQRKSRPFISDPVWYRLRNEAIPELKLLFQQIADMGRNRRRAIAASELLDWIHPQVEKSEAFPLLRQHVGFLRAYLLSSDDSPLDLLREGEKVSAAQFFDQWMSWRTGIDPEQLRQQISRIGSKPRISRA